MTHQRKLKLSAMMVINFLLPGEIKISLNMKKYCLQYGAA